jgi:hypothetical protein
VGGEARLRFKFTEGYPLPPKLWQSKNVRPKKVVFSAKTAIKKNLTLF